jgi:Glycosyl transferase family 2/Sulfotransferase domain
MGRPTASGRLDRLKMKSTRADTWSIVATVREPLRLVRAFVAHHLAAGAERINLYFDDPFDTAFDYLNDIERVSAIRCDSAYWEAETVKRPRDHRKRQIHNANRTYATCKSDWLIHCDADEFLVSHHNIGGLLAVFAKDMQVLRVHPVERTFAFRYDDDTLEFDGHFKGMENTPRSLGHDLYGELGRLFPFGFQGHTDGKLFARTGVEDRRVLLHRVRDNGTPIISEGIAEEDLCLAHFCPLGFEDWENKYRRRVDDPRYFRSLQPNVQERFGLYEKARLKGGDDSVRQLFEDLSVMDRRQLDVLEKNGSLRKVRFDMSTRIAACFGPGPADKGQAIPPTRQRSTAPSRLKAKVIQIGMRNCGTKDLCRQFALRGYSYALCDEGRIAEAADTGKTGQMYSDFDLLTEVIAASADFALFPTLARIQSLATSIPDAVFILNRRDPEQWAQSLCRKIDKSALAACLEHWHVGSEAELARRWIADWQEHRKAVRALFAETSNCFIEINIDKAKPGYLFDELERRGFLVK